MALSAGGCSGGGETYTLYRNSAIDPLMRIHVATFDAAERGSYNAENCELGAKLYQAQPGIKTRFWCEKGKYRP